MDRLASLTALAVVLPALVSGCTGGDRGARPTGSSPASSMSSTPSPETRSLETGSPDSSVASPTPQRPPQEVRAVTAWRTVRHLAGDIGPRPATGRAFAQAAQWVAARFRRLGYDVWRQGFDVPSGVSWGVPVPAGRSVNVIAMRSPHALDRPHLVLGAHLDTVPQAPGAEDNASGVGVLLAVAEAVSARRTRLPVVFVAFGAEEPRGPGDDDHHYGSRHYVAALTGPQRRDVRGMLALDRVEVGSRLPVCSAGRGPDRQRAVVLGAARRVGVRAFGCGGNRASDHWSFVRAGLPGVRLGSTPYAGYHNAGDVPSIVSRAQLRRAARTAMAWVSGP